MKWPAALLLLLTIGSHSLEAKGPGLEGYLPPDINFFARVRTAEIRKALANAGGVRALASNMLLRRAEVAEMVMGSQMDLASPTSRLRVQLFRYEKPFALTDMANKRRPPALIEKLANHPAFRGNRDDYFIQLSDRLLAVREPAQRQAITRWLKSSPTDNANANLAVPSSAHISVALDMRDMLSPHSIKFRLQASRRLRNRVELIEAMTTQLKHLERVRFVARVEDKILAELHLDFAETVKVDAALFRPILVELFDDLEIPIVGLEQSRAESRGKSVVLQGTISDAECSRLLSLMLPRTSRTARPSVKVPPAKPGEVDTKRTLQYYADIESILDAVEKMRKRGRAFSRSATWLEVYARQIEDLPIGGVEPELVEFGSSASGKLRELASSLWGTMEDVETEGRSLVYRYYVRPGHYVYHRYYGWLWRRRYLYVNSNLEQVRERQAAAASQGTRDRTKLWDELTAERVALRRKMMPGQD